jgi:hypothetical protein
MPKGVHCEIIARLKLPHVNTTQATQMGQYKQAASILSSIDTSLHRTLKIQQYALSYASLLKLKRVLRRYFSHYSQAQLGITKTKASKQEQSHRLIAHSEPTHYRRVFRARSGLPTLRPYHRLPHPSLQLFHCIHPHISKIVRSQKSCRGCGYLSTSAVSNSESEVVR